MLKAVIFDLDGVIVKFNLDSRKIKDEVIKYFEKSGFPKGLLESNQTFSAIRDSVKGFFSEKGMDPAALAEIMRNAEVIPAGYEIRAANETQLLPGVEDTLSALSSRGLRLALFTYNNAAAAEIALNKNGIRGFFGVIVTRDMVIRPKPNPLHLEEVLNRLGVSREEAIVVGDSEMDIKPSKELGVKVVAVTTGIRSADELRDYGPDHIIERLTDLIEIIEGFCP